MEEKHGEYFLTISGEISNGKKKEFEQTIRFVFNQLPQDCIKKELSFDDNPVGHCSFFSLWLSEKSVMKFMESEEFLLIKGAYSALGQMNNIVHGNSKELKNRDSNHLTNKK
jgi:hypothetical protein